MQLHFTNALSRQSGISRGHCIRPAISSRKTLAQRDIPLTQASQAEGLGYQGLESLQTVISLTK